MVWHSVRTETKEQAFARLTRPKSCHTLLNLNNPTASCAPIRYQNPYIRQTGDFKWPSGLSKARSLSELPKNNAKFLNPERSEKVTRRDMRDYFRKSMGVEEFGKVLCKLEAFVDAGSDGGGGGGGEALTVIPNNKNMISDSDSPKSNPYTTQSISLHSLSQDLSKIQQKLSLITKSQLCPNPGNKSTTTGSGGVLTSEGKYRERLKLWHPGQDGDFHLPAANPGYGRTPYGGHFTNFR